MGIETLYPVAAAKAVPGTTNETDLVDDLRMIKSDYEIGRIIYTSRLVSRAHVGEAEREAMSKLESTSIFQTDSGMEPNTPTNMPMAFWNSKVQRPSYDSLTRDINQLGFSVTGRKYGVSDNAVGKWQKAYEVECPV